MYMLLKLDNISRGMRGPSSEFAKAQTTRSGPDELTGMKALREGKEMLVRVRD